MKEINNQQDIFNEIATILEELFEIPPENIKLSSNLYSDLDIDSIDAVDLIVELKKMTGKKIKPEDFKAVRTVQDIVTEIEKLIL